MNILLLKTIAFFVMMVFLYFLVHVRYKWLDGRNKYHLDNRVIDAFARVLKERVATYRKELPLKGSYLMQNPGGNPHDLLHDALLKGDPVDVGISAAVLILRGEKTVTAEELALPEAYSDAFKDLMSTLSVGGYGEGLVSPEEAVKAIHEGIDMLVAPLTEAFVEKLRLEAELGALKKRLLALPEELAEKCLAKDRDWRFYNGVMAVADSLEEVVTCINDQ